MNSGNYMKYGYSCIKNFFNEEELLSIEPILTQFHKKWLNQNYKSYSKGAINSSSLTSSTHLNALEKNVLFSFISSEKIINLIEFQNPKKGLVFDN